MLLGNTWYVGAVDNAVTDEDDWEYPLRIQANDRYLSTGDLLEVNYDVVSLDEFFTVIATINGPYDGKPQFFLTREGWQKGAAPLFEKIGLYSARAGKLFALRIPEKAPAGVWTVRLSCVLYCEPGMVCPDVLIEDSIHVVIERVSGAGLQGIFPKGR
jgi:hypothetical protein